MAAHQRSRSAHDMTLKQRIWQGIGGRSSEDADPLMLAMRPPANETRAERAARKQAELEAARVSHEIDEQISSDREKARRKPIKVLLLGQSESGKSTTLKNFQMIYAGQAWAEQRSSWRNVVRLNLIQSISTILDHVSAELAPLSSSSAPLVTLLDTSMDENAMSTISLPIASPPLEFREKYRLLQLRLGPLHGMQQYLERRLDTVSINYKDSGVLAPDGGARSAVSSLANADPAEPKIYQASVPRESIVKNNKGWKIALDKSGPGHGKIENGEHEKLFEHSPRWMDAADGDNGDDDVSDAADGDTMVSDADDEDTKVSDADDGDGEASDILADCREDMVTLWKDDVVQEILRRRKVRMEDKPGFFLEDVDRIAAIDYDPTDDVVVRARLRTIGVQEHRFIVERSTTGAREWLFYDVGGQRSSRVAWAPYFEDVHAIIFLAPISAFDEQLARVNRLEDSYLLWKSIFSSRLLDRTEIILFLNKYDLLEKKLQSSVRVRDHVPGFGDQINDAQTAALYFQKQFMDIAQNANAQYLQRRSFYAHLTSVADIKATVATLAVAEECIINACYRSNRWCCILI